MDSSLTQEPVSTALPAFGRLVGIHLQQGEAIVVLFRFCRCGGAKDYFLIRERHQFDELVAKASAKTSITVFLEAGFLKGNVGDALQDRVIALLRSVKAEDNGIHLIRLNASASKLDQSNLIWLATEEEMAVWFAANPGSPVLVGVMRFWEDNNPNVVTAYVPDVDGVVRPGAY